MVHVMRAKISPTMGAAMKKYLFIRVGLFCSFINNLIASAKGCGRPIIDTLFGPFRS